MTQAHSHPHAHPHTGQPHGHTHHADLDWATEGPRLVREAEVYQPLTEQVITWLHERLAATGTRPDAVRRVLDIGSGAGIVTCLLTEAFPRAEVVAVDAAQPLLDLTADRAARHGVGDRVSTLLADLPDGVARGANGDAATTDPAPATDAAGRPVVAGIGEADVIWSRKVLHHVGDQRDVVNRLARALRPGGLIALTEGGLPSRFLPRDLGFGRPGLQARLNVATEERFEGMRAGLPGATREREDWAGMLAGAGLREATSRGFLLDLPAPLGQDGRAYLASVLSRFTEHAPELVDAADHATLAKLLDPTDPESLAQRADVFLLTAETVHTAYA
ncbi:class I SAM-dependent methyltransferase [Streptomyces sp. NPDC057702]|uniref:class I SAM-dependent methyltransferase n=1 Tax=unclassified Streptomyces TaxID=2593676 RepID=UPI0036AE6957